MESFDDKFNQYTESEISPPLDTSDVTATSIEEFVPKWKHIQEDLKYMFNIIIDKEEDLHSPIVKKQIYKKAIDDFKEGNPFTLDYFFEEGLLLPNDIKHSDVMLLKESAKKIIYSLKHLTRRTRSKELFIEAGILTEKEIEEL